MVVARPVIRIFCSVSVVCLLALCHLASAQDLTGSLEGRVVHDEGEVVVGVEVVVASPQLQGARSAVTDDLGFFRLPTLPVGTYTVRISHPSFAEAAIEDVGVSLGRTTSLGEIRLLLVAPGRYEVDVTGETPSIDPTSTTVGGNLDASTIDRLPVDRNYRSMVELLPQANPSGVGDETNVSGSTGLENVYFIDGVNVSDVYLGGGSTNIPYNFVSEIQVKQGGYEAEFGRSSGSIINVVTPTGGNQVHGEVFAFYTSSGMADDPRVANAEVASFSTYDIGFSIGGALLRDRLWAFAAYDRGSAKRDIDIEGFGIYPDETTANMFAGKLTWQVAQNTNIMLSLFGDPTQRSIVNSPPFGGALNIDPLLQTADSGGTNFTASSTSSLSDTVVLDASVSRYERKDDARGATEIGRTEPRFDDLRVRTVSGGVGEFTHNDAARTSAKISATWFSGRHALKGGLEYEDVSNTTRAATTDPGLIAQKEDDQFETTYWNNDTKVSNRVATVFVQDSWLVTDRLRLNLGLRWDGQYFTGSDGELAQTITDEFQPRVGLVYEAGRSGTQKIFASFGRFYQQMVLFSPALSWAVWDNWLEFWDQDPRDPGSEPIGRIEFSRADWPYLPEVEGLRGEHFDEIVVGYERALPYRMTLGVRGISRGVREAIGVGFYWRFSQPPDFGNPGRGELSWLPPYTRDYRALELTLQRSAAGKFGFMASYVYSRNRGNYGGLYAADQRMAAPQNYFSLQLEEQIVNSTGLLPNDRTHALKFVGTWAATPDLSLGAFFSLMSGTPLNELGATWFFLRPMFLVERGSAGRTPTLWDLNLRVTYNLQGLFGAASTTDVRVIADLQHVGSPRKAVDYDQQRFWRVDDDGNQSTPNPGFGQPLAYQEPMSLRLGLQIAF